MLFCRKYIYLSLIVFSLFQLGCKSNQGEPSKKAQFKSIYLNQFKLIYFRKLLIKGYNNSKAVQEIMENDYSGFTEPIILTESDHKLIDSLTTIDNEQMKIDSVNGKYRAEGAQGKRPLGYILDKINSKWLDQLARQRLKVNGVPEEWRE